MEFVAAYALIGVGWLLHQLRGIEKEPEFASVNRRLEKRKSSAFAFWAITSFLFILIWPYYVLMLVTGRTR